MLSNNCHAHNCNAATNPLKGSGPEKNSVFSNFLMFQIIKNLRQFYSIQIFLFLLWETFIVFSRGPGDTFKKKHTISLEIKRCIGNVITVNVKINCLLSFITEMSRRHKSLNLFHLWSCMFVLSTLQCPFSKWKAILKKKSKNPMKQHFRKKIVTKLINYEFNKSIWTNTEIGTWE